MLALMFWAIKPFNANLNWACSLSLGNKEIQTK